MPAYPKLHRLRSKQDFQSVYKESFRIVGGSFLLRLRPYQEHSRLGVMVSKKFGGAPYRNRQRRLLKELFRLNPPALPFDVHISQIRPVTRPHRAKAEMQAFFTLLQDRLFLQMLPREGEMFLKAYRPSQEGAGVRFALMLIRFYRRWLSPSLPSACRYLPTCSAYAVEAFRLHGFIKGFALTVRRILRCNPLGGSGYDPVPSPENKKQSKKSP